MDGDKVKPISILVIEPDHNTRVAVRNILEAEGHFVVSSASGSEALAILEKISTPSLILIATEIAVNHPHLSVESLRNIEKYLSVPIAQLRNPSDLLLSGTCGVVNIPVSKLDLLSIVKSCR
jgi:CheY-like chemotaxis protein